MTTNTDYVSSWKSKGLSAETIKPPTRSDNSLTPILNYYGTKTRVTFTGSCLKQPNISYTHRKVVNIYIVYELGACSTHNNDPTLKNGLFGAVTLTKISDIGMGILAMELDLIEKQFFSLLDSGFGQNVITFGVEMSSSAHIHKRKKYILILRSGPTQGLEHTLTTEKMYSINFTLTKKKFCLSLDYNGVNSYLFVTGTEIYKFKAKDSAIVATPLCLGSISKDWSADNMKKKQGLMDISMILV